MKTAVIYARVSSSNDRQDTSRQIEDLKKLTNFENTKKVLDTIKLELPETPNINDIKLIKLNREKVEIKASTALSLVLAGGISNLIDRIFRGRSSRLYRHISYY